MYNCVWQAWLEWDYEYNVGAVRPCTACQKSDIASSESAR